MSKVPAKKQVCLRTLGCKVNQYETQSIREQFLLAGFNESSSDLADVCVINTCTVTADADRECRRLIHHFAKRNPRARIVLTGCFTDNDALEVKKLAKNIYIVPNHHKHHIVDLLEKPATAHFAHPGRGFTPLNISSFAGHERAFVKIQDGCDNYCSYCKVPLVRGRSRSREFEEIISEVNLLKGRGFKEIVLTGICLGDYRHKKYALCDVLKALNDISGEFRIRLSSVEPHLVDNKLIAALSLPKSCPHLHIPLQSGSNAVLKKMHRCYDQKRYLSLADKIKSKIKNVALTTDVLVGFPQEEEKDFRETLHCLKILRPLRTHVFPYSPRPGTAAFALPGRLDPRVVKERMYRLKELSDDCSCAFRKRFIKDKLIVLVESQPDRKTGYFTGYTQNYIRVLVKNAKTEDINHFVDVRISAVSADTTVAVRLRK